MEADTGEGVRGVKLTKPQARDLLIVVRTNGGGAFPQFGGPIRPATINKLYELGLVQGKAGQQFLIVHTAKGLRVARELAPIVEGK